MKYISIGLPGHLNVHNYKHLWPDTLDLVHLIYSHKFSTYYFIFYRNGVTEIENTDKAGIKSRDPFGPWQ